MATPALSVDWHSASNDILLNPRMPEDEKQRLTSSLVGFDLQGHVLLSTSGSTGQLKWVALSKEGVLASAEAVNKHLQGDSKDIWFNCLPDFHVGGLGIKARSFLNGSQVARYISKDGRWHPLEFRNQLERCQATLTSLVPTQMYDLISHKLTAPPKLRGIIIGGGALSETLYAEAVTLGWKLLPSYGMTECSSQIATAALGSWQENRYPLLHPLSHIELQVNEDGFLKIKSPSLLSMYIFPGGYIDPKNEGWFTTEDMPFFEKGSIKSIKRREQFVKIGGESVDLQRLELILDEVKVRIGVTYDATLLALPDARLGHAIHLIVDADESTDVNELIDGFAQLVFPFERVRFTHRVDKISRSPLNKVLKEILKNLLT